MILLSIFAIVLCYAVCLYRRRKIVQHLKSCFNYPPLYPVFANLPYFRNKDVPGLFRTLMGLIKDFGPNVLIIEPCYEFNLYISNPKDVEIILSNSNSKSAKKSMDYELLQPWLGTGLLTSYGEKWFQRRKIITPSFHFSILEQFVEVMNRQSNVLVDKLNAYSNKEDFDIHTLTTLFALDVICESSMGIKINAQSLPDSKYVLAVKEITTLIIQRIFSFWKRVPGLYILFPSGRRHNALIKELHEFTTDVITNRRNKLLTSNAVESTKKKMNLIDMLLYANIDGKPLSNEDIREEVDTFMFEGHDTTTSGIAFALYQLAMNQYVQDKVYQEIVQIYENDPLAEMTYQKLGEMKYLEMVIKETLRIMPSVPLIGRKLTEDVYIDNKLVPAGSNVAISVYSMHHNPDFFPDPETFDPERFNPMNNKMHIPFSYVPFSAGGRNCIGQKFAMLELKTVLSKLIMNYRFLPPTVDNLILQTDLVLKTANGVNLKVESREIK